MPELRHRTIEWKKKSLNDLKQVISLLKETDKNFKMLCRTAKMTVAASEKSAAQLAKEYDRDLDENTEEYYRDADAMSALEAVENANEAFDEALSQVDSALEALLYSLEGVKDSVSAVKP